MQRRVARAGGLRVIALLALALCVRLLSPEGWMPAAGGLMLCPGASAAMAMPGPTHRGHEQPAKAADHPCAFAQAATAAPPPTPLLLPAPAPTAAPSVALRLTAGPGRGLAAPPPPATGPPAFA